MAQTTKADVKIAVLATRFVLKVAESFAADMLASPRSPVAARCERSARPLRRTNGRSNMSAQAGVPADPLIFHITHLENLPNILSEGGLWCDAQRIKRGLGNTNIGHLHIKQRRPLERWIPEQTGCWATTFHSTSATAP